MAVDWNPDKNATNLAKYGVAFEAADRFNWSKALVEADTRQHYGEVRLRALGLIGTRLHVLIYTIRLTSTWIISLRKANYKEMDRYENEV